MSNAQLQNLESSVLTCKKCKKYIKITYCPSCRAFYSISFKSVENQYYTMRCRRCHTTFTVDFPLPEKKKQPEKKVIPSPVEKRKKEPEIAQNKGSAVTLKSKKKVKPEKASPGKKKPAVDTREEKTPIHFKGKTLIGYNLRELLAVCASAFSLPRLVTASVGVVAIFFLYGLYEALESSFFSGYITSEQIALRSFLNLFPLALIFFIFIETSSLISRMTLENIFFNRKLGVLPLLKFFSRTWFPVFVSNIFILVAANTVITLFGNIPVVGPILFSLFFLPLYLLSVFILVTLFFGFWFYPPIIAYRNTGVLHNIKNFWHFLKKHNFTLFYIVPILMMLASFVFAGLYLIHSGALSLSLLITNGAGGKSVSGVLASIPPDLLRISELSFFGNAMGSFKDLISGLLFSQYAGGLFVGIVLASLSVLLAASFISLVSTLSTHVYILMERGVDIDDRKKLRLLGILVLMLGGILMVKRLFS
jgi:hypothetical protein